MSRVGDRWQMRFAFAGTMTAARQSDVNNDPTHSAAMRVYRDDPSAPLPGEYREAPVKRVRIIHPRTRSTMPVPKPLPDAIEAGHFGQDEAGKPIRPSRDEVRAITADHSERLQDALLDGRPNAVELGITQYAESFGPAAAERLRSYVQRLAHEAARPARRR